MSLEKRKTKRELNTEESRLLVLIEDNVELLSSPVFRVLVTGRCAREPAKLYSALLL